jgi:predicted ATPase
MQNSIPGDLYASAPVRSEPSRTYNPEEAVSSPEGKHTPFVLAQMETYEPAAWNNMKSELESFGKQSGLFEKIDIRRFGRTGSGPFQIEINTVGGARTNIIDVGYGVSQALPLVVELLRAKKGSMFLFQQPEVHLHPSAQAELATFFSTVIREKRHTIVAETHSDYILDRIRMDIRDGRGLKTDDVAILYFERRNNDVTLTEISIDALGNIVGAPASYRNFFLQEQLRSVGISED